MNNKLLNNEPERKPSLVPPFVAAFLSLLLPGLGQILARYTRRGLLLVLALSGILGLTVSRFKATARFDKTPVDIFWKALRLEPVLIIVVLLILFLYIWIARDAFFAWSVIPMRANTCLAISMSSLENLPSTLFHEDV